MPATKHDDDSILVAAVEGGGTSFVVAVGRLCMRQGSREIVVRQDIPTTTPSETLDACATFFTEFKKNNNNCNYKALGIACFGPLQVNVNRPNYGSVLESSPKAEWRNVDILTPLVAACRSSSSNDSETTPLAVAVDTDVNAPALAEYLAYKQQQQQTAATTTTTSTAISSLAYVTVGTGVGVGLIVNDRPVHGRMHPEGGHVSVQPLPNDPFDGYSWGQKCPFFGKHTVEGMASSVALTERLLQRLKAQNTTQQQQLQFQPNDRSILATLSDDDEIWEHAANALANLCVTLILTVSIERIVLGGGVMNRNGLLTKIQQRTVELMNGYVALPVDDMSSLISMPVYGSNAGIMGAVVLAERALQEAMEGNEDKKAHEQLLMKQVAFSHGLWHGMIVGALAAAVVFKYMIRPKYR